MSSIPDSFLGSWTSDGDENFDGFMASKDVPWVIRKAIKLAGHSIVLKRIGDGRYSASHSMMGRTAEYEFELGKEFQMKGMEGIEHKVTVTMENGAMLEKHQLLDKPNQPIEDHLFTIEGGKLVQMLSHKGVTCKRFFKKK